MIAHARFRLVPLVAVLVLAARSSPAQRVEVTGFGLVAGPRSAVLHEGVRETVEGVWLGAVLEVKVGRVLVSGTGLRGTLDPVANAVRRDGGEQGVLVRFEPRAGFGVEAMYTARAFRSAVGYQRWDILGVGAWVSVPLGDPALRAHARASYLPAVRVSGQPSPNVALAAEVGASATPRGTPLQIRLTYRFERFDFPGQPTARLEEFDRIALEVGYRMRR
ncbi:MAG TPA: hypothetical protein VGJ83_00015 [Gemmatimonadales bacterium]|jgi:hypothetical protein